MPYPSAPMAPARLSYRLPSPLRVCEGPNQWFLRPAGKVPFIEHSSGNSGSWCSLALICCLMSLFFTCFFCSTRLSINGHSWLWSKTSWSKDESSSEQVLYPVTALSEVHSLVEVGCDAIEDLVVLESLSCSSNFGIETVPPGEISVPLELELVLGSIKGLLPVLQGSLGGLSSVYPIDLGMDTEVP